MIRVSRLLGFVLLLCLGVHTGMVTAQAKDEGRAKPGAAPSSKKPSVSPFNEKGSFKILVDRELKGTEEFEITSSGNECVAKGKILLSILRGDKPVEYLIETQLQMKLNLDPIHYSMVQRYEGNASAIKMDFANGKGHAEFDTGSGVEKRDYDLPDNVVVLDDNVFHQYAVLARRYDFDRGGLQEFYVFIPQESVGGILHMTLKGDEKVPVNGAFHEVQHLSIDTPDLQMDIYVEGDSHRLMKVMVPSSNVEVDRVS